MEAMGVVVNARLAGLLGPAGRGRSWTALSIEWPLPKAVNLTSAIFTFHTLTVGVAQCGVNVRWPKIEISPRAHNNKTSTE
jgi:hypothetical protein